MARKLHLTPPTAASMSFVSATYAKAEVIFTPTMAGDILETRAPNRPIRQRRVDMYAQDIHHRQWVQNGETIKFDRLGRLMDGQHRLWAVLESGTSQLFSVALGLEPEAQATIDTGAARAFSDVLAIDGGINTRATAAVLRMIWSYEHLTWGGRMPTHTEMAAVLDRFPEVPEWVTRSRTSGLMRLGQTASLCFVATMGARIQHDAAVTFLDALDSGAGLAVGNPILTLRERMRSWRTDGLGAVSGDAARRHIIGVMIKAWNAHLAGRDIRMLKLSPVEAFPAFDPAVPGLGVPAFTPTERRAPVHRKGK